MAGMVDITNPNVSKAWKIKYDKASKDFIFGVSKVMSRPKRSNSFVGTKTTKLLEQSLPGGYGPNRLPVANSGTFDNPELLRKKLYAVAQIDRATIKAAKDEGSWLDAQKNLAKRTTEKFALNEERIFFHDGTASLGTVSSVSGSGPYSCVITDATWKLAHWALRDYVNFGSGSDLWEVTAIAPSTKTVTFSQISGSGIAPAASDVIYIQGGKSQGEPEGIKGVLDATNGTKYNLTVQYGWQAKQVAAGGAGIDVEKMVSMFIDVQVQSNYYPNMIVTSPTQMKKLLVMNEDKKSFVVNQEMSSRYGDFSFSVVKFIAPDGGAINFLTSRFCDDDRMYFLNDEFIDIDYAPGGPEWVDEDGGVWKRVEAEDALSARFAAYGNTYVAPTPHGVITGLATA